MLCFSLIALKRLTVNIQDITTVKPNFLNFWSVRNKSFAIQSFFRTFFLNGKPEMFTKKITGVMQIHLTLTVVKKINHLIDKIYLVLLKNITQNKKINKFNGNLHYDATD